MKNAFVTLLFTFFAATIGLAQDDFQDSASDSDVPELAAPAEIDAFPSVIEQQPESSLESVMSEGSIPSFQPPADCYGNVPVMYQDGISSTFSGPAPIADPGSMVHSASPLFAGNQSSMAPGANPFLQPNSFSGPVYGAQVSSSSGIFIPGNNPAFVPTSNYSGGFAGQNGNGFPMQGQFIQQSCPHNRGFGSRGRFFGRFR